MHCQSVHWYDLTWLQWESWLIYWRIALVQSILTHSDSVKYHKVKRGNSLTCFAQLRNITVFVIEEGNMKQNWHASTRYSSFEVASRWLKLTLAFKKIELSLPNTWKKLRRKISWHHSPGYTVPMKLRQWGCTKHSSLFFYFFLLCYHLQRHAVLLMPLISSTIACSP